MADPNTPPSNNPSDVLAGLMLQTDPASLRSIHDAQQTSQGSQYMKSQLGFDSTDDDYIPGGLEQWPGKAHQEIYESARNMQPDAMHGTAKKWSDISASLSGALFGLNLSIQKALSDGMQGQTADAAMSAARKFVDQATDVQEVIKTVGLRVETAAYGAEAVKRSVPPPPAAGQGAAQTPGQNPIDVLLPQIGAEAPGAAVADQKLAQKLHQDAIAAMHANYDPTYGPAGQGIPTFIPVQSPGDPGSTNGPTPGGDAPGSTSGTAGGPAGNSPGTGDQQPETPGDKHDPNEQPADTQSASTGGQSPNSPGGQGSQNSPANPSGSPTTPASSTPSTMPSGLGGAGGGGSAGGGSGLSGGGASGPGSGGAGGPGKSVPGGPNGGTPAAAAASGASGGKAGTPGMGGMPGMGGARKNEDSEREHKTPDYLVTDREAELLGEPDPAVPQALGADFPSAQPNPDSGEGRRG